MTRSRERGYAMAALLVALAVMGIMLSVALPVWRTTVQREREAELLFRGQQYVQAIELYSRRTGGFPTALNALRDGRYIRQLYKDPITNGDFQPVFLGQIGPGGVPVTPGQPGVPATPGQRGQPPTTIPGATPPPTGFGGGLATQPQPTPSQTSVAGGQIQGRGLGQPLGRGVGPIIGVVSRSTAQSIRVYNGRNHYNEWVFATTGATQQPGAPAGGQIPAGFPPGRGGRGGRGVQPGAQPGQLPGLGPGGGFGPNPPGGPTRGVPEPNRGGLPGMPAPFNPGRGQL